MLKIKLLEEWEEINHTVQRLVIEDEDDCIISSVEVNRRNNGVVDGGLIEERLYNDFVDKLPNGYLEILYMQYRKDIDWDKYEIVKWPCSQDYMEEEWFEDAELINDDIGLEIFGSSAFIIEKELLKKK